VGTQVAFFRNMNLGQARSRSPRSTDLLAAFEQAGATRAVNFQTNGTVIFDGPRPRRIAATVVEALTALTGYHDLVVVRPADWLVDLAGGLDAALPAAEVALFDGRTPPALELPHVVRWKTGTLTIVALEKDYAVTTAAGAGVSAGPVLPDLVGVPVTCRGVPTMLRLAARLGSLPH
jgi:hypothetical protein